MPYAPVGVYVTDQWRQVGVTVEHEQLDTKRYQEALADGTYTVALDFYCDYVDEPNLQLVKFLSADRSPMNYGGYIDRTLDDLYDRQKRAADPAERYGLVRAFEQRVLTEAYTVPTMWWHRIVAHSARLKGWRITPSHYLDQDLADVWLAE
jgi:peptide/nickel transport system substrate-binding protein